MNRVGSPRAPDSASPVRAERFERKHRLLKGREFKAVFDKRRRFHGAFFSVHLMPNDLDCHRIGLAVSRKVSKKAVERNRIKRQVRESFRTTSPDLSDHNLDIVIVAKPAAAKASNDTLRQELVQSWRRAMSMFAGPGR